MVLDELVLPVDFGLAAAFLCLRENVDPGNPPLSTIRCPPPRLPEPNEIEAYES